MIKAMIAIALAAACAIGGANAQDYPSRFVTLVVPLATGGSTDTIARIIAEGMRPHLGQTVVVENSPGAGGSTGVVRVARATPDGYRTPSRHRRLGSPPPSDGTSPRTTVATSRRTRARRSRR